jgi:3-deoxy-manno-octulosonate cytidylyltransferase (CMP-KDO synthetase)
VWQRVQAMGLVDRSVIATDSDEVVEAVRRHGADVVLTSADHPSGTDRVAEVVARREYHNYDAILNVQGDEPFVPASALRGAVHHVTSGSFPLGTAAAHASEEVLVESNVVKVVAADDGRAMYFSRAAIPFLRDAAEAHLRTTRVWQHIGVYAYARDALAKWVSLPPHPLEKIERLEQLRPLAAGLAMGVALIDEPARIGVDTADDLERANAHWTEFEERS